MSMHTQPNNRMVRISVEESKDFIKRFNQNVISKEQLEFCKSTRKLFTFNGQKQE